jgi:ABC-type bacteriocin/lantibiotic exporter with double-glycine peptidase domain
VSITIQTNLVEPLVDIRVVKIAMNPINTAISYEKEESNGEEHIRNAAMRGSPIIKKGVSFYFTPEPWNSQN